MIWGVAGAAVAAVAILVIWASYRLTHRPGPAPATGDGVDHDFNERRQPSGTTASIVITLTGYDSLVAEHGEQVGLDLCSATTSALVASIRDDDVSYRFADDEFAVLLTGTEADGARRVAHRIGRNIERQHHGFDQVTATLDSSTGHTRVSIAATFDSPRS